MTFLLALSLWVVLALAASDLPSTGTPAEESVRSSLTRATPLLTALEAHKIREGRYPQYLEQLIPKDTVAIPLASGGNAPKSSFVYHGENQSFELFFLLAPSSDLFLYRSSLDYPDRREPGPYRLVKRVGDWAWYRVIPMRGIVKLREWKGRRTAGTEPLRVSHVTDAGTLEKLWSDWQVGGPAPRVDFARHIVLTAIVRSSVVLFKTPVIDDRGDLKRNVVATPDAPHFWSYALCLVERDGIRSVEGQPVLLQPASEVNAPSRPSSRR